MSAPFNAGCVRFQIAIVVGSSPCARSRRLFFHQLQETEAGQLDAAGAADPLDHVHHLSRLAREIGMAKRENLINH